MFMVVEDGRETTPPLFFDNCQVQLNKKKINGRGFFIGGTKMVYLYGLNMRQECGAFLTNDTG